MNIFVIARGYPSNQDPHWGCFEKDQAEALSNMEHKVSILSVDCRFRLYWRKLGVQTFQNKNISVFNIFVCPNSLLFFLPQRLKQRFEEWQLNILYKRASKLCGIPDILYSHYLTHTKSAVYIQQKYGVPLVGIEHWSALNIRPIPQRILQLANESYPYVDHLIAVSNSLKESILELNINHRSAISVVHNMVGEEFYYNPTYKNDNTLTFISTGRLVYGKGFDLLINALSQIQEKLPKKWRLYIVGGGELKNELQQQINQVRLEQHIHLLGQKNKEEIVQLLQQSDIFILPSRGENFSVAVLEALACGLPVISSICGGIRECIDIHNGLLFPVENTVALANAIMEMVQNLNQYNREAIAQDCHARFAPEVIAKQLTTIFEETIKTHKEQQ